MSFLWSKLFQWPKKRIVAIKCWPRIRGYLLEIGVEPYQRGQRKVESGPQGDVTSISTHSCRTEQEKSGNSRMRWYRSWEAGSCVYGPPGDVLGCTQLSLYLCRLCGGFSSVPGCYRKACPLSRCLVSGWLNDNLSPCGVCLGPGSFAHQEIAGSSELSSSHW